METKALLQTQEGAQAPSYPALAIDDEPALAALLLERGLVTEEQLRDALEQQQTLAELGERRTLAEVLLALGYVTAEQLGALVPAEVRTVGGTPQRAAQPAPARESGLTDRLAHWLRKAIKRPA